jgi:hypothetical protein
MLFFALGFCSATADKQDVRASWGDAVEKVRSVWITYQFDSAKAKYVHRMRLTSTVFPLRKV